jgi:hypothetical protein
MEFNTLIPWKKWGKLKIWYTILVGLGFCGDLPVLEAGAHKLLPGTWNLVVSGVSIQFLVIIHPFGNFL